MFQPLIGTATSLKSLIKRIDQDPFPKIELHPGSAEVGFDQNPSEAAYHSAGYDAFATGKLFLALTTYIGLFC